MALVSLILLVARVLVLLVVTFHLAKKNGQRVKSLSWSKFSVEFYDRGEPEVDTSHN